MIAGYVFVFVSMKISYIAVNLTLRMFCRLGIHWAMLIFFLFGIFRIRLHLRFHHSLDMLWYERAVYVVVFLSVFGCWLYVEVRACRYVGIVFVSQRWFLCLLSLYRTVYIGVGGSDLGYVCVWIRNMHVFYYGFVKAIFEFWKGKFGIAMVYT